MTERPPLPYDHLPPVPSFTLESGDVANGEHMPDAQVYSGWEERRVGKECRSRWSPYH